MSRISISYDLSDPETWVLEQPYERQTSHGKIVVPQGFRTDLASTPRQVWRAFPRWGTWSGAAIIHDYLYRTQPDGISRYHADRIMLKLMREDGVHRGTARIIYRMVREYGDTAWRSHQGSPLAGDA